jgi:hypothetical protein
MRKVYKAVCTYDDGTQDEATVVITSEGDIFQVAWEISNGEKDRAVLEAASIDEAFAIWCEENDFKPAE